MNDKVISKQLQKIMYIKNLKQVDILNLARKYFNVYGAKISKSDLSQYVLGNMEPSTRKFLILCKALKVSTDYLLGIDDSEDSDK